MEQLQQMISTRASTNHPLRKVQLPQEMLNDLVPFDSVIVEAYSPYSHLNEITTTSNSHWTRTETGEISVQLRMYYLCYADGACVDWRYNYRCKFFNITESLQRRLTIRV